MSCLRCMLFLFLALLTACSTASDYQVPITAFSAATTKADEALAELDKRLAGQLQALRRAQALDTPAQVRVPRDQCATEKSSCTLLLLPLTGQGEGRPLTVTTGILNQVQALHEVALYAKGLQDIVDADATEGVRAGLDTATAAAASLAALIPNGIGPAVSALSVPLTETAVWLFGVYQENVKLRALREATARMDPILQEAVSVFRTTTEFAVLEDQGVFASRFNSSMREFEHTPSEATLERAASAASEFDRILKANPTQMYDQLGVAHRALSEALASKEVTFAQALMQIQRLATKAEELAKIAESFKTAAESIESANP